MKNVFKGLGAICSGVLVFALGMLCGADVTVSGWLLWYLFALSFMSVVGLGAWIA